VGCGPENRDFVGLAENAWDFNAPGSIAGFGPLEMTEELRREVARMVGRRCGQLEIVPCDRNDGRADGLIRSD